MSIRNFPENPKIILRKSADQAKGAKNKNYEVAILICANFEDIDVLLRGATLDSTLQGREARSLETLSSLASGLPLHP